MSIIGGLIASTIKSVVVLHRRSGIITTNKTVVGRFMSSKVAARCYDDEHDGQSFKNTVQDRNHEERKESCWIPDSRTGIYYPKGHQLVLKDVPDGAASFTYTYWHRNSDLNGV
uniref:uncharacterized protein LOC122598384 n=1 Tax=Erigeron canadensis TaxID=72917 RepID=UPI001CB88E0F|nr:uncharacterized protein LOC122598384 [Erigeron canadensis]